MNTISKIVSAVALLFLLLLPLLHFVGFISLPLTKSGLLVVTILWFISAPLWMGRLKQDV
jgi:hypothetical protein